LRHPGALIAHEVEIPGAEPLRFYGDYDDALKTQTETARLIRDAPAGG